MRVLGITGGLATGKSLAAEAFRRRGAEVISADAIAHELTGPSTEIARAVTAEFGDQFLARDGSINRSALADHVFRDADARRRLEAIIHPPVLARIRAEIERFRNLDQPPRVLAVEVPLLYEVGIEDWFDAVVVVAASYEEQVARLMTRDGLDAARASKRIAAQTPLSDKIAQADYVIWNTGKPGEVESRVADIMART